MKNLTFLIALISFLMSAKAQNIPSYVPTDSLIGYWGFDGNANDYSGNSNNGTVYGASLTDDRNGNANSAYEFDYQNWSWGSGGDRIFIPHNTSFNCNQITVSAWAKRYSNGYGGNEQLAIVMRYQNGYSSPHGEYWGIMHRSQSTNYDVSGFILKPNQSTVSATVSSPPLNSWTHYALSFDGTYVKLYIDGQLVSSELSNGPLNTDGTSGISVGVAMAANGNWQPFDGKIDDLGYWGRALSESEIKAIYNENVCTDTIQVMVYDTTYVTVNDTITHNDTNFVTISDTVIYYDSVSVAVTDTLIINAEISGLSSPNNMNTLKVYPNPANDVVIIDNGDFSLMSDYKLRIVNSLGAEVFNSFVSIPQFQIPVSSIGGNGLYYIQIFDKNSSLLETKKLILK